MLDKDNNIDTMFYKTYKEQFKLALARAAVTEKKFQLQIASLPIELQARLTVDDSGYYHFSVSDSVLDTETVDSNSNFITGLSGDNDVHADDLPINAKSCESTAKATASPKSLQPDLSDPKVLPS